MWSHRQQPTRLPHPWDSPGKNTGVGCHFLLQCVTVKSESEVAQSCPTLSDPWTAAYQAPPSMGFSRQEYWSGVPLPSPKNKTYLYMNIMKYDQDLYPWKLKTPVKEFTEYVNKQETHHVHLVVILQLPPTTTDLSNISCEWYHALVSREWSISFSIVFSRCFPVAACISIAAFFNAKQNFVVWT